MKWLLIILVVGGIYMQREPLLDWLYPPAAGPAEVVMYATKRCPYCAKARRFFAEHGIPYEERDVDASWQAQQEFQRYGGSGVPLFVIDGKVIKGYSEPALRELARR